MSLAFLSSSKLLPNSLCRPIVEIDRPRRQRENCMILLVEAGSYNRQRRELIDQLMASHKKPHVWSIIFLLSLHQSSFSTNRISPFSLCLLISKYNLHLKRDFNFGSNINQQINLKYSSTIKTVDSPDCLKHGGSRL